MPYKYEYVYYMLHTHCDDLDRFTTFKKSLNKQGKDSQRSRTKNL